jgi:hypothetical protein
MALGLTLAGAACASPTDAERILAESDAAEALWLRTRPLSYALLESRSCECLPEWAGPVRLRVTRRQGAHVPSESEMIVEGTYVMGGEALDAEQLSRFVTVSGLFERIRDAVTSGAVVEADFDPDRGYPREVFIDPVADAVDDEVVYHLEVVDPGS